MGYVWLNDLKDFDIGPASPCVSFTGLSVRCCLLIAINERQDFSIQSFNQEWQKVSCKSGAVMLLICWVLNYKNVCHILAAGEGRPAASRGFRWGQDYSRRLSCGMSRIIFWCVSLFIGVTLINAVNYYHKGLFILINTHSFWVNLAQWPFKDGKKLEEMNMMYEK